MTDLNRLLGSVTLTQLLDMLREMGILVSSPYEQMLAEERASSAGPELEDVAANPPSPPEDPPAPAPAVVAAPAPAPSPPPPPAPLALSPVQQGPPRPNEAVFAGLLLALSQLGINPNGDPAAPASSSTPTASTSAPVNGGRSAAPELGGDGDGDVEVVVAPPLPEPAGKGKGKELAPPPAPEGETLTGFVCASCKTHNLVRPAKDTWYVVTVGKEVGVFRGWHNVQPLVTGVSGACYKKYTSEDGARIAFAEALAAGNVVQLS
ncbi:hypothetical protein MD484_g8981, partial [Candolleomyces efflorescens]